MRIHLPNYLYNIMSKVLNISEAATIAIHSMGLIARSDKLVSTQEIADTTGFSKNHISKILQQLVKNGYLVSTRGPKGGFILSEKAKEKSLLDIFNLIEGELEDNTCKMHCENCPFSSCIFGGLEKKFTNEFKSYLMGRKVIAL